jgi:hypothetical protein
MEQRQQQQQLRENLDKRGYCLLHGLVHGKAFSKRGKLQHIVRSVNGEFCIGQTVVRNSANPVILARLELARRLQLAKHGVTPPFVLKLGRCCDRTKQVCTTFASHLVSMICSSAGTYACMVRCCTVA